MNTLTYTYRGEELYTFEIDSNLVPENSLLRILHERDNGISSNPNLPYIIWYVQNRPPISNPETIEVLDYWGVYRSYSRIWTDEKFMWENMYNDAFVDHPMNTEEI